MVARGVSEGPWAEAVGYCRWIRSQGRVIVSGTAPLSPAGEIVGRDDAYLQATRCLERIQSALEEAGTSVHQVVRTRMFVTNIDDWREVGRAHREFFADAPPATTMVEVRRLIDPRMLVEIEAEACCGPY